MMKSKRIKAAIKHDIRQLNGHEIYGKIQTIEDIVGFMKIHVFAVWDFMNLLKTLQQQLTCVSVPWVPVNHTQNARLINEIVLEEESDVIDGKTTSHFEYYVAAIKALDTSAEALAIEQFLDDLRAGTTYENVIKKDYVPKPAQEFLRATYDFIQAGVLSTASAFTYGRETVIPEMFIRIVDNPALAQNAGLQKFVDYLKRHIELDGDVHGNLAEQMIENLCQTDADIDTVIDVAKVAINARLKLWDGIVQSL